MIQVLVGRRNGAGIFKFVRTCVDDGTTWDQFITSLALTDVEAGELYYSPTGDDTRTHAPVDDSDAPGDGTFYTYVPSGVAMPGPVDGSAVLLNPPDGRVLVVQPHPNGTFDSREIAKVVSGVNVIAAPGRAGQFFLSLQDVTIVGTALGQFNVPPGAFGGGTVTVDTPGTTAIPLADIAVPADSACGGWVEYVVSATDGTDQIAAAYVAEYLAVNKGGTISVAVNTNAALKIAVASGSASTLTFAASLVAGAGKVTLKITPQAASPALTSLTVKFNLMDRLGRQVTPIV